MNAPIYTAADNAAGERHYSAGDVTYPAVGTILKATASTFGLDRWKADVGEDLAEQIREESAARGRRLEAEIDAFLFEGREPDDPTNVWWQSVRSHVLLIQAERTELCRQVVVVHDLDRYAGTLDLRSRRRHSDGRKVITDWKSKSTRDRKTNKVVKPTRSKIYDHLCQVAAYCDAEAWETGERPDGEVVIALPDREALVFSVTPEDQDRWRKRLAQYYSRE